MPTLDVASLRAGRLRCDPPSWRVLFAGLRHPIRFTRELVDRVIEDRITVVAAALAYYFFLALFPFLLFLLALVTVVPIRGLEDWLLVMGARVIPGEAYGMLERTVRGVLAQPRSGLVSVGAALALWGASSAFASIMDALTAAYRVPESRPWWRLRLEALGLTIALSAFMIVAFVLALFGGQLATLVGQALGPAGMLAARVARWVVVILTLSIVVAAIYWACPDVEQRWVWVTPGSLLFTLGFGFASAGFGVYVGRFAAYDKTYGSLGAVIILLFWLYLGGFFLLLGGEVNALLEHLSPAGKKPGKREEPQFITTEKERAERARG
jgi:membrane protein